MKITLDPDTPQSRQLPLPQLPEEFGYYREFYSTPNLTEGTHTIRFQICEWQELDLGLVRVGRHTPLHGKTLLVDDSDSQVEYSGIGWSRNGSIFEGLYPQLFDPMLKTSHETASQGDMITFRFYGTSVSLWGFFSWMRTSNIVVVYTLDGRSEQRSYPVTDYDTRREALHFPFYSAKDLTPSHHVLTANVTGIQNTTFRFDYITYEPSFANFASMPDIPLGPAPVASSPLPDPAITASVKQKSPLVGKIVGGFIGGFLLVGLVLFVLVRLQFKRRQQGIKRGRLVTRTTRITPFSLTGDSGRNQPRTTNADMTEVPTAPHVRDHRLVIGTRPPPPAYDNISDIHHNHNPAPTRNSNAVISDYPQPNSANVDVSPDNISEWRIPSQNSFKAFQD
ncbi:hypothetical protein BJ165DRAFT_627513 [Panaeolus papilionaceus]|nr:hypothetical protein BJ165DRAFT_627513 [Panaeolus papilionaceus]